MPSRLLIRTGLGTLFYLLAAFSSSQSARLIVPIGHTDGVSHVAFAPGEEVVATASYDHTAKLWKMNGGQELFTFIGHEAQVTHVAFSLDGTKLLTCSFDRTAIVWDVASGKRLATLRGSMNFVTGGEFSPDGSHVVTSALENEVRIWDARTGKQKRTLVGHHFWVTSASYSTNGSRIVSSSWDKSAIVWDAYSGRKLLTLKGHSAALLAAGFSPDGSKIVTASLDNTARLWDAKTGRSLWIFRGHTKRVVSASFSRNGLKVVTCSQDNTVRTWDVRSGRQIAALRGGYSALFSRDGSKILLAFDDHAPHLINPQTGADIVSFPTFGSAVTCAAYSLRDAMIALGSADGGARILDAANGREMAALHGHGQAINDISFSPDGDRIVTASTDQTAKIWDSHSGDLLKTLAGHFQACTSARFSPDSSRIVTTAEDLTAREWDSKTGQPILAFQHPDSVWSGSFSADGTRILTACNDSNARVWNATTGEELLTLPGTERWGRATYSPDAHQIATASPVDSIKIWNAQTGAEISTLAHSDGYREIEYSHDGVYILTNNALKGVQVWNAHLGSLVKTFGNVIDRIITASISNDSNTVATPSADGKCHIWNRITGTNLVDIIPLQGQSPIFVTPDNRFDTTDIEGSKGLHWVVSDDPFTPLPLDVFMRLYFEPNLYARVMKGEQLPPIPSIGKLNRVQPRVEILAAMQGETSNVVAVKIRVSPASRKYGTPKALHTTGARDLRVFRDRRLIKMIPGRLVSFGGQPREYSFEIEIPKEGKKSVQISAYALNDSGVKSETPSVDVPVTETVVKPKAYVISVGVNACQDPDWHLFYAVDDAKVVSEKLCDSLRSSGVYDSVLPTILGSETGSLTATTDSVHETIKRIEQKAKPQDLVVITWSGHGFVGKDAKLHLVLSNTGAHLDPDADTLPGTVSSDELSNWLQDLDARSALILDACHSMASVSAGGFKAGPMGDRGLGQLSYDKGMMVLAASQDSGEAVETQVKGVGRGLLTYALIDRGLAAGPKSMRTWLTDASNLVPSLYRDLKDGKLRGRSTPATATHKLSREEQAYIQTPQLFDFAKNWDAQLRAVPSAPKM